MDQNFQIAIGMYERGLTELAQRVGAPAPRLSAGTSVEWAAEAEGLALAGARTGQPDAFRLLQSVVGHLFDQSHTAYYTPQPISTAAVLPNVELPQGNPAQFQTLWASLATELRQIEGTGATPAVQEASLLGLLQRTCWAVPAPQVAGQPDDVSLYDYTRVSAALAVCMPDSGESAPALLVGGDLSGVQDWLYALSSSGVAKNLRGRSFYLQLLGEVIAQYVLDRLGLPACNLLYAGGGNFFLLAPLACQTQLDEIQKEISRKLLRMHEGALYVALGHAPISRAMLTGQGDGIGSAWDGVNRAMNQAKARRFSELENNEMAEVIGAPLPGTGEPLNTCAVCRRSIDPREKGKELDEERRQCDLCTSFEHLGNLLRDADYLVLSRIAGDSPAALVTGWPQGLAQFGYDVQLLANANQSTRATPGWETQNSAFVRVYYWKDEPNIREFPGVLESRSTVWAFRPLAQCTPIHTDGEIATFDQLTSEGIDRWGVLRMDVDNLGKIFQEGIPGSSLSRVVGLSALLRLYFEGHVPWLAQAYNRDAQGKNRARLYLMYAGGDDLFMVGGWSDMPHLAHAIRQDFAQFACHNPRLSISGGISIALSEKYPLYQAARQAGNAEHQAKYYRRDEKDALSFLGEVMRWEGEYSRVSSRVDDLKRWLGDGEGEGRLPRSFLMTLRSIDAEWRAWKERESGTDGRYQHADKKLYLGPWQWHLVYSLARAGERSRNTKIKEDVKAFAESIVGDEILTLGLIARWTELETRGKDER